MDQTRRVNRESSNLSDRLKNYQQAVGAAPAPAAAAPAAEPPRRIVRESSNLR